MTNELFDKPIDVNNRDKHLSLEALSAYLDGELSGDEHGVASDHLASCKRCLDELASLRAISTLMRDLPALRPARSFQLRTEHATGTKGATSGWLAHLLGWMPALRAATAGVALLLVVVVAGDVLTNRDNGGDKQPALLAAPTATLSTTNPQSTSAAAAEKAAPTNTPETMTMMQADEATETESEEENVAAGAAAPAEPTEVPPAAEEDTEVSAFQGEESPAADQSRVAEPEGASTALQLPAAIPATETPEPSPTPPPTATPEPSATPEPTATATPSEASGTSGGRVSNWRIAEIALGLLLAWLIVTLVGLKRLRRE